MNNNGALTCAGGSQGLLKLVFLPRWLENPIKAAGADLKVLTDPKKLLSILSKEDVAFYLHTQSRLFQLLSAPVMQSFEGYPFHEALVKCGIPQADIDDLRMMTSITGDTSSPLEVVRAFMGDNYCPHIDSSWVNFMLTVEMLDHETVVVRMVKDAPTEKTDKLLGYFYEQLLKLAYMFHPFHRVAETTLFKAYLDLMCREIHRR